MCAHAHAHALTRARVDMYVTHAYVRMYARSHKDTCARTRARAHARMHARPSHKRLQLLARARTNVRHARICTHVRTFTQGRMCALALTMHTHACTRGRVINGFSSWRARVRTYVMHAYARMYAFSHKDACACTRARVRTHAHARTHTRPSHKRLQLLAGSEPEISTFNATVLPC